MPNVFPHDKNYGEPPSGFNQGNMLTGAWHQVQAWPTNIAKYFTEQYNQQIGPLKRGRILDVLAPNKQADVSGMGGYRGVATWLGGPGVFNKSTDLHMPCPGDQAILWTLPSGEAVILGTYPPSGERGGIALDAFDVGITPLFEDRHSMGLNPGNEIIGYSNGGRPQDLWPEDKG